jgi:hypothetical protein
MVLYLQFWLGLYGKIGFDNNGCINSYPLIASDSKSMLKYFRFGPLEWLWRSLTYKKMIKKLALWWVNTVKKKTNKKEVLKRLQSTSKTWNDDEWAVFSLVDYLMKSFNDSCYKINRKIIK